MKRLSAFFNTILVRIYVLALTTIFTLALTACSTSQQAVESKEVSPSELESQYRKQLKKDLLRAFNLGRSYFLRKEWKEALPHYEKVRDVDVQLNADKPEFPFIYRNLGDIYRGLKRDEEAILHYEKSLIFDSEAIYTYRVLEELYREKQDWDNWQRIIERLITLLDDAENKELKITYLKNYRLFLKTKKKFDHEMKILDELILLEGPVKVLTDERLRLIQLTADPDTVLNELIKAHNKNPKDTETIAIIIDFFEKSGDFEKAITWLDKFLAVSPGDKNALEKKLRIYLDKLNDETKALKILAELSTLFPDNPQYFTAIAEIHLGNQKYELAAGIADKALKIDGDYGDAVFLIAESIRLHTDTVRKIPVKVEDKLVYEIALKWYLKAADYSYIRDRANRIIKWLYENMALTPEDNHMKTISEPESDKYKWVLKYKR